MSIGTRLAEELKDAMRARDADRVACIRQVRAKVQEVVNTKGFSGEIDDDLHTKVISSYVKSLRKAIEEMAKAGDKSAALREKYQAEIDYLDGFMPKLLDEAQTKALVLETITTLGVSDPKRTGEVMGAIMKSHAGKVEPGLVRRLIQDALS